MVTDSFEYKAEERNGVLIIWLKGTLDIGTVASMKPDIDSRLSEGQHRIILELSELENIDSSGVGALITLFKRVRPNKGDIKVARLLGQPREIFRLLRLDRVFEIYDDLDEAIASFQYA